MKGLEPGYSVEVDQIDKAAWHGLLRDFHDATFYQTWSYGERFWGGDHLSHVVLRHDRKVVSVAQLRILKVPLIGTGAAYLNWGPLWKSSRETGNHAHLRNMARALRDEYVASRHYALRILPKIFETSEKVLVRDTFARENFRYTPSTAKTFLIDLRMPLERLRENLPRSWRKSLKFAEQQGLRIWEATEPAHYGLAAAINKQMKARKSYFGSDSEEMLEANADLPRDLKLKTLLCDLQGETVAALGWSNIGMVAFPLVGGSGDKALQCRASFLLWWEMIKSCQAAGFEFLDTAGVHEKRNPGGYFFKKGLAGKDAAETTYFGRFDAYTDRPSYVLFNAGMAAREAVYNGLRQIKASLR